MALVLQITYIHKIKIVINFNHTFKLKILNLYVSITGIQYYK
jgi:hypothetical protein